MGSHSEADIQTPWSPFIGGLMWELSSMNLCLGLWFLNRGPFFTFVFQLTTVQSYTGWFVCQWSMHSVKFVHFNGLIADLWFPGFRVPAVASMLLLLCSRLFSDAGCILLPLSVQLIHLSLVWLDLSRVFRKKNSRLQVYTVYIDIQLPKPPTSCYGDCFQQHS